MAAASSAAVNPEADPEANGSGSGSVNFAKEGKLVMLFTCSICNTRAAKAFSKASYERGVVIVDCPGCHKKHLIADNLGWLGKKGSHAEPAGRGAESGAAPGPPGATKRVRGAVCGRPMQSNLLVPQATWRTLCGPRARAAWS